MIMSCGALRCTVWLTVFVHLKTGIIRALTKFFWHLFKSEHVRLVQYRARKQAADLLVGRLLTRAVLRQRPYVSCFDLWETFKNLVNAVISTALTRFVGISADDLILCRGSGN